MPNTSIFLDTSEFEKEMKALSERFTSDSIVFEMELVADELIRRAIDSPIPSDRRMLANSAAVTKNAKLKEVTFGFNSVYAAFQDAPNRSQPYVIRPVRKKILFIPLTRAAKYHRYGNNPNNEGLVYGKDYVLAMKAVIPIKPYGHVMGPNHYFSETLKRNKKFAVEALAARVAASGAKKST